MHLSVANPIMYCKINSHRRQLCEQASDPLWTSSIGCKDLFRWGHLPLFTDAAFCCKTWASSNYIVPGHIFINALPNCHLLFKMHQDHDHTSASNDKLLHQSAWQSLLKILNYSIHPALHKTNQRLLVSSWAWSSDPMSGHHTNHGPQTQPDDPSTLFHQTTDRIQVSKTRLTLWTTRGHLRVGQWEPLNTSGPVVVCKSHWESSWNGATIRAVRLSDPKNRRTITGPCSRVRPKEFTQTKNLMTTVEGRTPISSACSSLQLYVPSLLECVPYSFLKRHKNTPWEKW